MSDNQIVKYEIGKAFPGILYQQEGCSMELWESLTVIIQAPGLMRNELRAFKKSIKSYAYLEAPTSIPIAFFIFNFQAPLNFLEVNFDATLCSRDNINNYLTPIDSKLSNMVTLFLLDRNIIKALLPFGFNQEAIKLFHTTIKKQCEMKYSKSDYDKCLNEMYKYSSNELYNMGKKFYAKKRR